MKVNQILYTTFLSIAFSGIVSAELTDILEQTSKASDALSTTSSTIESINNTAKVGQALTTDTQSGLVETLVQQLGISETQAKGGSGALFQVAKNKMSEQDFSQLSQSVPDMDGMLASVPDSSNSLIGGLSSLAGKNSNLADAASVIETFKQLNLSEGMVSQFTPVIIDYVKKSGGEITSNLLSSALSGF